MSRLLPRLRVAGRLLRELARPAGWRRRCPQAPARILVLHHLLLGDCLMLAGLLAKLAAQYPDSQRFVACPEPIACLFAEHPFGFTALGWDPRHSNGLQHLFAMAPFDLVVIPAENRHSPLARALGARWIVGFDRDQPTWKNWLLDDAHAFPKTPRAFVDFAADLVAGPVPRTFTPADWPMPACPGLETPSKTFAVLHPGASTRLKYWPAARWQALAGWLEAQGITPVWSGGGKETGLVTELDPAGKYSSYAGKLDLVELAELYRAARLIVCPDTGVTHLARIVGTPTVALFGPGSSLISGAGEYWRDSPFLALSAEIECRDQDVTFRRHETWIRRCARSYGTSPGQCAQPRCMEAISLETVQEACLKLLKRD